MSTGTWGDVLKWAQGQVEAARTKLETASPSDIVELQARIKVMRELQHITDAPKAPEMPPSVPY
jgi:hypothetical protein